MTTMALCRLNNKDTREEDGESAAARTVECWFFLTILAADKRLFISLKKKEKEKKEICC